MAQSGLFAKYGVSEEEMVALYKQKYAEIYP